MALRYELPRLWADDSLQQLGVTDTPPLTEQQNKGDRLKRVLAREYQNLAEGAMKAVDYYERLMARYPTSELTPRDARMFGMAQRDAIDFTERAFRYGGLIPVLTEDAKARNAQLVENFGWASIYTGLNAFIQSWEERNA